MKTLYDSFRYDYAKCTNTEDMTLEQYETMCSKAHKYLVTFFLADETDEAHEIVAIQETTVYSDYDETHADYEEFIEDILFLNHCTEYDCIRYELVKLR